MEHPAAFKTIGELPNFGISHVVICPGSRSAPLALLAARHPKLSIESRIDERSAGYIALGMAKSLQQPVALICTSGTAVLNFYPAIAEAFYQHIPILILTADRPPHLIDRLDGQAIRQRDVFKNHIHLSVNAPFGEEKMPLEFFEKELNLVQNLLRQNVGPIHINIPLNEPLYNIPTIPYSNFEVKAFINNKSEKKIPNLLAKHIAKSNSILLLAGMMPSNSFIGSLRLPNCTSFVSMAEPLANVEADFLQPDLLLAAAPDALLAQLSPDLLITCGNGWVSKRVKNWLKTHKPKFHWHIDENGSKVDPFFCLTGSWPIQIHDAWALIKQQIVLKNTFNNTYYNKFDEINCKIAKVNVPDFSDHWSELSIMAKLSATLPKAIMHLANSTSVRLGMVIGLPNAKAVYSNRGTSGIDGCSSTAVGAAIADPNHLHILITGDLAFIYDQHAFWGKVPTNLKVILFNNGGGGIFSLIDGPYEQAEFTSLFFTPNHVNIDLVSQQYGLDHYLCNNAEAFNKEFPNWVNSKKSAVLEIKTTIEQNRTIWKGFFEALKR